MIYHIYWGTAGNSGLYLDAIYQVLKNAGYEQRVFVSAYYPFDYGEKIFFPKSEIEHCKVKGVLRRLLQAFEFFIGFTKVLISVIREKPEVINYSLIHDGSPYLVKLLKVLGGGKLVITCHDVIPFEVMGMEKQMSFRKKVFSFCDFLLVHNQNSKDELLSNFGIDENKIIIHRFPLMKLYKLYDIGEVEKKYDFLFIGHMRKEKGIHFMLDAWHEFHKYNPEAKLCLAGNPIQELFDIDTLKKDNIEPHLHFIPDKDYVYFVKSSRYVLFPYYRGTNSGVISTVLSLGSQVVCSDIPMFKNNPMVKENDLFTAGDKDSFISILERKYRSSQIAANDTVQEYESLFASEVLSAYSFVLSI